MNITNPTTPFDVAIIGGGFSGTMVAIHLLRSAPAGTSIAIVERREQLGLGRAYDTHCQTHLLNVPVASMSAFPQEPNHFLRWCEAKLEPPAGPDDFVPRRVFGQYVESLFDEALTSRPDLRCERYRDTAIFLELNSTDPTVRLKGGTEVRARRIVLAIGGLSPSDVSRAGSNSKAYIANPWEMGLLEVDESNDPVLILGSGLTAVDTVMTLVANGFSGSMIMLSRHGLMPQVHKEELGPSKIDRLTSGKPQGSFAPNQLLGSHRTRELLRKFREEIKVAGLGRIDWRLVLDSLRPVSEEIWSALPHEEQKRLLRHVRTFWEVHRHRMAPQIGRVLAEMLAHGQARVVAGVLTSLHPTKTGAEVSIRERGTDAERTMNVSKIINCTGHGTDVRTARDPLLRSLLDSGIAVPDSLCLGLSVSPLGAVIDRLGSPSEVLYVIGSLRKGNLWETTAVRELREQAKALAQHLIDALAPAVGEPHVPTSPAEGVFKVSEETGI